LAEKLECARRESKLPKIVIPVHFAGQSCEMREIRKLADQYDFRIIEDASHAIGGSYLGEFIGNCRYSDITVFSFHPVKIITTAEGGMLTTKDPVLAARLQRLRSHGITRDPKFMKDEPDGPWSYQQIELGFNYRITDIQAALGYSQLQRLDDYIDRRHQIRNRYDKYLKELPIITPWQHPDCRSALHLYPIQVGASVNGLDRKRVYETMREAGIGVNVHYIPVQTQPYYQRMGFKQDDYPVSMTYYQRAISLPIFPTLTNEQQLEVVGALKKALS
jgi:dTDP-4-amino-4,6-dideoxygalactose transaminase